MVCGAKCQLFRKTTNPHAQDESIQVQEIQPIYDIINAKCIHITSSKCRCSPKIQSFYMSLTENVTIVTTTRWREGSYFVLTAKCANEKLIIPYTQQHLMNNNDLSDQTPS